MCKFSGLVAFPFDSLKCSVDFGGWGISGDQQGLKLMGEGFTLIDHQEAVAGSSYQEYTIERVDCWLKNHTYGDSSPGEVWPVVAYTVHLGRASNYYTLVVLFPGVLITLLAFAVFWMEPEASDALAYGITVVLASELTKIVLVGIIPVCGELLWVEIFTQTNS